MQLFAIGYNYLKIKNKSKTSYVCCSHIAKHFKKYLADTIIHVLHKFLKFPMMLKQLVASVGAVFLQCFYTFWDSFHIRLFWISLMTTKRNLIIISQSAK